MPQGTCIGRSRENREIRAWRAGKGASKCVILAGIHPRERLSSATARAILDEADSRAESIDLTVVPVVNPDGDALIQRQTHALRYVEVGVELGDSTIFHRKNLCSAGYEPSGSTPYWAHHAGVDLNRNFPTGWGAAESSDCPSDQLYRGLYAASEPETKAVMFLLRTLARSEGHLTVISLHGTWQPTDVVIRSSVTSDGTVELQGRLAAAMGCASVVHTPAGTEIDFAASLGCAAAVVELSSPAPYRNQSPSPARFWPPVEHTKAKASEVAAKILQVVCSP